MLHVAAVPIRSKTIQHIRFGRNQPNNGIDP
jgi:hypothetical protein